MRFAASCIPSLCSYQITPKTSLNTRCSASMLPNFSINGRIRSSGQLEDDDTASIPAETTNASVASPCLPSTNGHTDALARRTQQR